MCKLNIIPSFFFAILFLIHPLRINSQTVLWQKRFGTGYLDRVVKTICTRDKGFLILGNVYKYKGIDKDNIFLLKIDSSFNKQWECVYGGPENDNGYDIIQNKNGYVVVGGTESNIINDQNVHNNGGEDCVVMQVDTLGNVLQIHTYGGSKTDYADRVLSFGDTAYLIGAVSDSKLSGDKTDGSRGSFDYWVFQIDDKYQIDWQKTIGGNRDDRIDFLEKFKTNTFMRADTTNPVSILVGGTSWSKYGADKTVAKMGGADIWCMNVSRNGDIIWQNAYGANYNNYAGDVLDNNSSRAFYQDTDNFYLIGASQYKTCSNKQYDYSIYCINNSGMIKNIIQLYANKDDSPADIIKTSDNGWLISGISRSDKGGNKSEANRGGYDLWIIKLDAKMNVIWDKTFGGHRDEVAPEILEVSRNTFLIPMTSSSDISGDITNSKIGDSDVILILLKDDTMKSE